MSMKANELRIGNQIYINSVVHKITAGDIVTIYQNELFGIELQYCNPIKITEDILSKVGFKFQYEKVMDRVYAFDDFCLYWNKQSGYHFCSDGKLLSKGFIYVHQLQNIYFDLTGKIIVI